MKHLSTAKKTTMVRRASILIISLFFLNLTTSAQMEFRPFVEEGKAWETTIGMIMENSYGSFIEGDTLIGGETWKKVYNYTGFREFGKIPHTARCRMRDNSVFSEAEG